jgi:hypothetical protein
MDFSFLQQFDEASLSSPSSKDANNAKDNQMFFSNNLHLSGLNGVPPPLPSEDAISWLLLNMDDSAIDHDKRMDMGDDLLLGNNDMLLQGPMDMHPGMASVSLGIQPLNTLDALDAPLVLSKRPLVSPVASPASGEMDLPDLYNWCPPSPASSSCSSYSYRSDASSPSSAGDFDDGDFDDGGDGIPGSPGKRKRTRRKRVLTEDEKERRTQRRLEKNRESARMCRQRKNKHMSELEDRVASLENENLRLRRELKLRGNGGDFAHKIDAEKQSVVSSLSALVRDSHQSSESVATDTSGLPPLETLVLRYKDLVAMGNIDKVSTFKTHARLMQDLVSMNVSQTGKPVDRSAMGRDLLLALEMSPDQCSRLETLCQGNAVNQRAMQTHFQGVEEFTIQVSREGGGGSYS